jgi:hypothetical protein
METASQIDKAMELLEAQIREAFGRLVYTHKTQEKCADLKLNLFNNMRWCQTGLSAVTSTGFIAVALGDPDISHNSAICAGLAALALAFVNAYMQGSNAVQEAEKHSTTASKLWLVRESYISLITDVRSRTIALEDAKAKRDALDLKLSEIYGNAPRTTGNAYKAAQEALKLNEELTFTEAEIDLMLPVALRKAQVSTSSDNSPNTAG